MMYVLCYWRNRQENVRTPTKKIEGYFIYSLQSIDRFIHRMDVNVGDDDLSKQMEEEKEEHHDILGKTDRKIRRSHIIFSTYVRT